MHTHDVIWQQNKLYIWQDDTFKDIGLGHLQ